ncbi:MAG: hypothetical protein JWN11_1974, partial [Hyphomicrobiales bacterium]|nr:hypothetical protein [Hyphomicrobiales bacterium]
MKSKYSNIAVLCAAILAFSPVVAVDYLLDGYVRVRETSQMQQSLDGLTAQIQTNAYDAIASLRRVLADSPSLCTPTFIANVHTQMQHSLYLKQVLVENADGVQYCDAFGQQVSYTPLSESLSIPGHPETLTVVKLSGLDVPVLKVTQAFGGTRKVSAFVPVLPTAAQTLLGSFHPGSMVRVSLTNGTQILGAGDATSYDKRSNDKDFLATQSFAGELPLRSEAAVPFALVRSDYADLDFSFTFIAGILSAAFLVMALQYVRRSRLPAFDLERAIDAGELKPFYQPVINLATGKLAGCEVLCRWEKRNGKMVPTDTFIDYAEVTGLAVPMTIKLMKQVRTDLSAVCAQMPDLKVSINLFEGHFRDGAIVEDVRAIFGGSDISFRQLTFEIT